MKIKLQHADDSLCGTCRNLAVVRGTGQREEIRKCTAGFGVLRFKVRECSSYDDARVPHVYQLEQTAWRWYSDRFVSPAEFARLTKDEDDD
jgi:hypothetical protein